MSYDAAFNTLKDFLENKPASTLAIEKLRHGTEIRIIIDDHFECTLLNDNGKTRLESRRAINPDIEFIVYPDAIRLLENHLGINMAQFGIDIAKEILAGNVKFKVCGGLHNLLSNGYFNILREAGPELTKFLTMHGLQSASTFAEKFKNLRG